MAFTASLAVCVCRHLRRSACGLFFHLMIGLAAFKAPDSTREKVASGSCDVNCATVCSASKELPSRSSLCEKGPSRSS